MTLPFAWDGVTLHATGATALSLRLTPHGTDHMTLGLYDASGAPVAEAASLRIRQVTAEQLTAAAPASGDLFALRWTPADVIADGAAAEPRTLTVTLDDAAAGDLPARARGTAVRTLAALQEHLAEPADGTRPGRRHPVRGRRRRRRGAGPGPGRHLGHGPRPPQSSTPAGSCWPTPTATTPRPRSWRPPSRPARPNSPCAGARCTHPS